MTAEFALNPKPAPRASALPSARAASGEETAEFLLRIVLEDRKEDFALYETRIGRSLATKSDASDTKNSAANIQKDQKPRRLALKLSIRRRSIGRSLRKPSRKICGVFAFTQDVPCEILSVRHRTDRRRRLWRASALRRARTPVAGRDAQVDDREFRIAGGAADQPRDRSAGPREFGRRLERIVFRDLPAEIELRQRA